MRIGLVADPCDENGAGGLGRAIYELTAHVAARAPKTHDIVVYAKRRPSIPVSWHRLPDHVWLAGHRALDPNLDWYIFFTPVISLFFKPKRAIVVAHDFVNFREHSHTCVGTIRQRILFMMQKRSLRYADTVVCVSAATKKDAVDLFGIEESKCIVVPIAGMPPGNPVPLPDTPEHFFLFVGVLKERKNIANMIRAFAQFAADDTEGYTFFLAGKAEGEYAEELHMLVRALGMQDRIRFLGFVTNETLAFLYQKAAALCFVSSAEGFGMPVVEAFRAGCPVITAHDGALAETAGDAALLSDPQSPLSIAHAMRRIAHEPETRKLLIQRGKEQGKSFSWDAAADTLLTLIKEKHSILHAKQSAV